MCESREQGQPRLERSVVSDPKRDGPGQPSSTSSPFRIAVSCLSHKIPGPPSERLKTMGNIICQHHWGRDMDEERDFIRTTGFPHMDAQRVRILLDSGTLKPDVKPDTIPILAYRWSGTVLKSRDVGPELRAYILQNCPFRQQRVASTNSPGKTKSELRGEMSTAEWDKHMKYMVSQKIKYQRRISKSEREWLEKHLGLFDEIMKHHVARRTWYKLPLWRSQELWLGKHEEDEHAADKDADVLQTTDLKLMHSVLEQYHREIQALDG